MPEELLKKGGTAVAEKAKAGLRNLISSPELEASYYDFAHPFVDTIVTEIFGKPMAIAKRPARTARGKREYRRSLAELHEQLKSKGLSDEERQAVSERIETIRAYESLSNIWEFREKETVRWISFLRDLLRNPAAFDAVMLDESRKYQEELKLLKPSMEKGWGRGWHGDSPGHSEARRMNARN